MNTQTNVHAEGEGNELTFRANRLWDRDVVRPEYGHDTVVLKIEAADASWRQVIFVDGDDATLFDLHSKLHDLADQVEELISPDAMIVVAETEVDIAETIASIKETTSDMIDRIGDEPMVTTEQDGEGM